MDASPPPTEGLQSAPEVPAYPAPLPDLVRTCTQKSEKAATPEEEEEVEEQVEEQVQEVTAGEADPSSDPPAAPPSTSNGVAEVEADRPAAMFPPSRVEAPLESPIAQPEELCLPNGLPLPAPQDPEVPTVEAGERDASPIAEPDIIQESLVPTTAEVEAEAPVAPAAEQPAAAPQESSVEQVAQAVPAESEVQETVPADAVPTETADVEESPPVPQPTAKEEKPSSAETVSITDSTSEPVPTSPPPTAEEREELPPPLTATPALVETTMQGEWKTSLNLYINRKLWFAASLMMCILIRGQLCLRAAAVSVPKKKRKIKELNKKEAVGDLLDAFKEVRLCLSSAIPTF